MDLELLLEAERRGIIPQDKGELLAEARSRGLIPALDAKPAPEAPQRGYGEELVRQGGLGIRHVAEGAAGLAGIPANALGAAWNLTAGNLGAPRMGTDLQGSVGGVLDRMGLPKEQTGAEKLVGSIDRGIVGASPVVKAAQLSGSIAPIVKQIATQPGMELTSAATGAGAAELTKQAGAPEWAQMAAGAVAPMAAGAIAQGVRSGSGAINELRRPVTQKGAEQIAADVLGRVTQDKTKALENLARYNKLTESGATVGVPGSRPTAGAVAGDYGIVGGQQVISRGDASPQFAMRQGENNAARIADIAKLNATEEQVAKYAAKRDAITAPLREQAFANAKGPVDFVPVAEEIGKQAATAAGGRAESQKALSWLAQRLEKYQAEGRVDPKNAYALHQDIGDLIAGKVKDDNGSALRLAGGLANQVKQALAQQIEVAAPGFKKYMNTYSRLSKPIERLEILTEKLGGQGLTKVTNSATQLAGDQGAAYTLSGNKLRNVIGNIEKETTLAPRQNDILKRVLGDSESEAFAQRAGKQPGSDTYQNIASANFMNRVLGDTLAQTGLGKAVQAPLSFASKPFESRIQDLIVQAYQDPKLFEALLKKARTSRNSPTLAGLLDFTAPRASGGLLGALVQ